MSKRKHIIIKVLIIAVSVFAALSVFLFAYLNTQHFKNFVKNKAEDILENIINADIQIDSLHGFIPFEIKIINPVLKRNGKTVFEIERLEVKTDPFSLIKGIVNIKSVNIVAPYADLSIPEIFEDFIKPAKKKETGESFIKSVAIQDIYLTKGKTDFKKGENPVYVNNIMIKALFLFDKDGIKVKLTDMSLNSSMRGVNINDAKGSFVLNDTKTALESLNLVSDFFSLKTNASLINIPEKFYDVSLSFKGKLPEYILQYMPFNASKKGNIDISFKGKEEDVKVLVDINSFSKESLVLSSTLNFIKSEMSLSMDLKNEKGNIRLKSGGIFAGFLNKSKKAYMDFNLSADNFYVPLTYIPFLYNINMESSGSFFKNEGDPLKLFSSSLNLNLKKSSFDRININKLNLKASSKKGNIFVDDMTVFIKGGNLNAKGLLKGSSGTNMSFNGDFKDISFLNSLLPESAFSGICKIEGSLKGREFLNLQTSLKAERLSFNNIYCAKADFDAAFSKSKKDIKGKFIS